MKSYVLFAIAGLIAPIFASPAPQESAPPGDDPESPDDNNIQETAVKVGGTRTTWGNTYPWDALSLLHSGKGGPCDENGCDGDLEVKSMFVIDFAAPVEYSITIHAEGHYIGTDVQDALIGAAVQAITPASLTINTPYGDDQTEYQLRMAPPSLVVTLNDAEGDQKGDLTITMHPNTPISDPEDSTNLCSAFSSIASGISAALSVGAPIFAVPAGAFGIISATCQL